jgi:hypothetical protein
MRIMICGSMTFSKEMLEAKKKLDELGHETSIPCDTELHLEDAELIDDFDADYEHCIKNNIMKKCMDKIAKSDAILVMNHAKNGIDGYIGTSTLMETGLAYYLGKKIFLMFPIPSPNEVRWAHEVSIFQPSVIDGDFGLVK